MRSSSRWEEGSNTTLTTMQKQWVAFQKHWKTRSQRGFSLVSKCLNWTVKIDQLCGGEEHWGELESWTTLRTRCVQQVKMNVSMYIYHYDCEWHIDFWVCVGGGELF